MGSHLPLKAVDRVGSLSSDGVRASFPRSDADRFLDIEHEYLAVTDAASARGLQDCLHRGVDLFRHQDNFNFHLRQEVNDIFGPSVKLGVALLAPEPFGLGDRNPLDPDLMKGLLHLVKFEWLDDGFNFFHLELSPRGGVSAHTAGLNELAGRVPSRQSEIDIVFQTLTMTFPGLKGAGAEFLSNLPIFWSAY